MSNEYEDLIEELYKNHYKEMISYAMSSLRRDIAEEVVQDAFRIACTKKEILKEKDNKASLADANFEIYNEKCRQK